jgi:hypothetical protein
MRLASQAFVPVAGDDWYQRRREDAEGRFFRTVADQGPRKGVGGATRQGIYLFTAGGKLLAFRNNQDPAAMRQLLQHGLREWQKLPLAERKPGAVHVPDAGQADPRYSRTPPAGGLIVNVYTRILDRNGQGEWCQGTCSVPGGEKSARDHLWLTAAEVKSLVPAQPRKGSQSPVPPGIVERILRFHLHDNTRGEPEHWRPQEIRTRQLTLTVEEATATTVRLRLDGSALLSTDADPAQARRGFDVRLLGYLTYHPATKTIERFDVVAVGDHWGEGTYTRRARPGRTPLGVAFELARGDSPADQVPPQGIRDAGAYFGGAR